MMPSTIVRNRSGAVDSRTNTSSGCARRSGSDASMPRSASLTAGSSEAGSTAVRITNATGTPELLFCAHGKYNVGSGCCVTLTSNTSSTTPTMVSGGGVQCAANQDLADGVGALQQALGKPPADHRHLRPFGDIVVGEPAPLERLDLHRLEVVGADAAELHRVRLTVRRRAVLDV